VTALRVLSLGFTRELWEDPAVAGDDTLERMRGYAEHLASYHVVAHSLRAHALESPRRIAPNFHAYATGGRNPAHSWARMLALARQLVRTHRFDLVQTQEPVFTGTIGEIVGRGGGVPHNVCVYGANPFDRHWVRESARTRLAAPVGRRVLRAADGVQVDGTGTAASLRAAGVPPERIAVKPMVPPDLERFFTAAREASLRDELSAGGRFDRLALFVGRLAPQKDVAALLAVIEELAGAHTGLRLVVAGDGPLRRSLEGAAARRIADRVLWLGPRPHGEVARVMAACDLFVLPSRYEGFARVLMEAAAARLPIVTTAVSGADEAVLRGATGLIVPVGDAAALRSALDGLLRDRERAEAMGRAGREHMRELAPRLTSPRRQVEIWEELVWRAGGVARARRR
jgi:glycosyltransferase involved in cell wall biosynthesis